MGVEFSELLITADSFDLDGTPTGPNTFVLAEPSLVAAGISSPPTGILYDDPAVAAAPGVIGAAVDFTDGFYIGYMGVKWTNDIFTPAAPAYFNVPVAGSVDYQTGSGWFGMFGGVINVLNPSSAGTPPSGQAFVLAQNYPNPFRSDTTIRFRVDQATPARVRVFDVRGRLVRTLVESELPAGTFHVTWDGRDQNGAVTAPGIYFVRMSGFGGTESRRMVRLP